jgi:chromosome segregation ATPase
MVSQDEVIASLTQELSDLKDRCKVLETKAGVPETSSSRIPVRSSETWGKRELPTAERVRLTAESNRARQEVERLSAELSSLRDEKLTLVADLNSAILAKEALVAETNQLAAERDTAFAGSRLKKTKYHLHWRRLCPRRVSPRPIKIKLSPRGSQLLKS